jgi:hypothetical protein
MARAYGWNAKLLLAFETTYGTAPASGAYKLTPFVSCDLDSAQGLIASNVLGLGRDPTQPYQDVINVDGDVVVPMDLRNIGNWLKAVFGAPTTTGTDPYTHVFASGKTTLPSLALELGLPEIPDFPLFTGVRANSIAFNFQRSGEAQATINLIGQGETAQTITKDNAPDELVYTRISQFQGSVKKGGVLLGNVTSASVTYNNNLERVETIRSDGKLDGVDPGVAALTGSLAVRYADTALMDAARAGTPIDLELSYVIDADNKLVITCHEVYLPKPKRSVSGPGGVEASYDFQGARDATIGNMVEVTLINDEASY